MANDRHSLTALLIWGIAGAFIALAPLTIFAR